MAQRRCNDRESSRQKKIRRVRDEQFAAEATPLRRPLGLELARDAVEASCSRNRFDFWRSIGLFTSARVLDVAAWARCVVDRFTHIAALPPASRGVVVATSQNQATTVS